MEQVRNVIYIQIFMLQFLKCNLLQEVGVHDAQNLPQLLKKVTSLHLFLYVNKKFKQLPQKSLIC